MNLLNIYVVLAYYDTAEKNTHPSQAQKHKITHQKLNVDIVNQQLLQISHYKQSALHWNRTLIEDNFVSIYKPALDSYEAIANTTGTQLHDRTIQEKYLDKIMGDFNNFKDISVRGSQAASVRESQTTHELEYLSDGMKATIQIKNYLDGVYHLTIDEVVIDKNTHVIQESKNSTSGFLPSLSDIKDGLFKLILYSNLDTLCLNSQPVAFKSRLKLTGRNIFGALSMPCSESTLAKFLHENQGKYSKAEKRTLDQLNQEASNNKKLSIQISPNTI